MRIAPNGRPFFIDHNTKTTTWVRSLLLFGSVSIVRSDIHSLISSLHTYDSCREISLTPKLVPRGSSQPASRSCTQGLMGGVMDGCGVSASCQVGCLFSRTFLDSCSFDNWLYLGEKQCCLLLGCWCSCFTSQDGIIGILIFLKIIFLCQFLCIFINITHLCMICSFRLYHPPQYFTLVFYASVLHFTPLIVG